MDRSPAEFSGLARDSQNKEVAPMHVTRLATLTVIVAALLAGCVNAPNSLLRLQAKDAIDQKDYGTAREMLDRALAQDPADWKANYYMGLVKLAQGRALDARLHLEVAYSLRDSDPETPDILDALAESLYKEGAQSKLDIMLRSAASTYGTPRDYYRQAEYLARQGDVDGARAAYLKAVRVARPEDITPFMKQADFYEGLGDKLNAVTALQQAQSIEPQNRVIAQRISRLVLDTTPGRTLPPEPVQNAAPQRELSTETVVTEAPVKPQGE
jgi:tetratricopeptide (TPR) repeat protein